MRRGKFKVWDNKTNAWARIVALGKEEWVKQAGLFEFDMDGFYLFEDGDLYLFDDCGKQVYCDPERFIPYFRFE